MTGNGSPITGTAPLGAVLSRIATATGALRVRSDDAARLERNGAVCERLDELRELIARLEQVADDLEAALA